MILKSDESSSKPALWRVDGKTLIQKYECVDGKSNKYKCVNTYSGWTQNTRSVSRVSSIITFAEYLASTELLSSHGVVLFLDIGAIKKF